jgi:hypothetical protein
MLQTTKKGIHVRCLLQIELPVETSNAGIKSGKLPDVIGATMEKWKPEAAYFFSTNGKREIGRAHV